MPKKTIICTRLSMTRKITSKTASIKKKKINYQRYLLIGISILTTFLYGCQEQVEYRLDAEFIFVNQSDKTLSFSVNDPSSKRDEIILKKKRF